MLMKKIEQIIKIGSVLCLFLAASPFAASIAPFYFDGVAEDQQQAYWDDLMKYKLWGTQGIVFNKENVTIAEQSGYSGTAHGPVIFNNGRHNVGGPILVGGKLQFAPGNTSMANDTLFSGYVRVLDSVTIADYRGNPDGDISKSFYKAIYCVAGGIRTNSFIANDGGIGVWVDSLNAFYGTAVNNNGSSVSVDGTYDQCPSTVPQVDTHLSVPLWTKPDTISWGAAVEVSNSTPSKIAYIHVPPEDLALGDTGTYDMYLTRIRMLGSTGLKVFVLMPPGGRLTRILLQEQLQVDPSANDANIRVVYANSDATFDRATMQWTWDSSKATFVTNDEYAGNLLIYSPTGISWSAMVNPIFQGTFMTPGIFSIKDHFTLAGQLISDSLHFESNIKGDFRYVPFDPPILNIDPTANGGGIYPELNQDQKIDITLDSLPKTNVYFDYCFEVDTATVPVTGLARAEDFGPLSDGSILPVCGVDTSSVVILAGNKQPDSANAVYFNPVIDGFTEPQEILKMNIFNLSGAVLEGNKKTGSFDLKIADTDLKPVVRDTVISGYEDDTLQFDSTYFPFSSEDTDPDTLISITITSLPHVGSLLLDNVLVTKDQVISKDSLSYLTFVGAPDSSGSPYTTFDFIAETKWGFSHVSATISVNLLPVNDAPQMNDSLFFTIAENSPVGALAGVVVADDPDDESIFTYTLVPGGDGDALFQVASDGKVTVKLAQLNYEVKNEYYITVEATDNGIGGVAPYLSETTVVKITILDVNEAPVVNDTSWTIAENNVDGLDIGTVIVTDEDALSTHTFTLSGSSLFEIDASGIISVASGVIFDYETMAHTYTLKVIVKDNGLNGVGASLENSATVTISISDVNEAPIIANQSFTVPENSVAATVVGNLVATDPENRTLSYKFISGNEANCFTIDGTGKITVLASNTLNYESDSVYTLVVDVSDDGLGEAANVLTSTATITIHVQNINEAPVVSDASWSFDENNVDGLEIGTVVVTDEDALSTHTYTLSGVNSPLFVINSSGTISTAPGVKFDYETMDHTYNLTVTVRDNGLNGVGTSLETTATVTISLLDRNDPPVITDQSFDVLENSAAATLVGNLIATDPENGALTYTILSGNEANRFVMDASGKITVRASNTLDYEDVNQYTLVVEVADDGLGVPANALKTSATITINVQNVNEAPVVSDASWSFDENNVDGLEIGTVVVTDEDAFSTHTYTLSGVNSSLFVINSSGTISTAPGVKFDYETMDHTYTLTVTAKDNGLNGVGTSLETTATVTISLLDRNDPPVITNQSFDVLENSASATLVGNTVATDPEGGSLTYTILSGNEANLFVMDASGKITVRASNSLDYDTMDTTYYLLVEVSDDGLGVSANVLTSTATITIHVKNVNETPIWNNTTLQVYENEPVSTNVGTVSATDEDLYETLIYTIVGGSGQSVFEVNSSTGVVTSKAVFDYETQDSYTIDVEVDDGEFKVVKTFNVAIMNVNEPPVLTDTETDIDENVPLGTVVTTVTGVDVDTPVLTYDIIPDDDGEKFKISSSGAISVEDELDYETKDVYRVKVIVSDGVSRDTATVTISINDINEAPILADAKFYVSEAANSKVKIGSVKYTDPENDPVIFTMIQDTSGLFRITNTGDIYLKENASLDFESVKSYLIKVQGTDPDALADSANIEIAVTNVIERSIVKITTAITKDSIYPNPNTIYINSKKLDLEWTEDEKRQFGDTLLTEGFNRIIKEYCVDYKDECGADTLDVYVSTQAPGITLYPKGYSQSKVSGVTIVEQKKSQDTSFYVNRNENRIVVTVTDPGTDGKIIVSEFELTADLQTVNVPSSVFETLKDIEEDWHFENNKVLSYSIVNNEEKASYQTKVNGKTVTVTYDLHKDSTTALITYVTKINGQDVSVSYVVDRETGDVIKDQKTGAPYSVGYTYVDMQKHEIFVSYPVDSKGKIVKNPEDESVAYNLSYSYTNIFGNSATKSIDIVLDKIPPVVQIIRPLTGITVSSVSLDVAWTVDGIEQDTLTLQSLENGANYIIRAYRDKAGNETADTVIVVMKNAKTILISMEDPLVEVTKEKLDEFNRTNPPAEEDRFGVSLLNVRTNTEDEVIVGTTSGTKKGSGTEPYPGLSGSHLGPTLQIDVKLPSLTSFGGQASLADLIESDGLIAIEAGGGWDRKKVTVEKYVSDYCTDEFRGSFDITDPSATPLYKTSFKMNIWIYSSLGNFLDEYSFSPKLESRDYVNAAGVVKMYFELKPDGSGYLRDKKGRLLGTGAYLTKTEIKMTFVQQCTLPDQTPVGTKKVVKEDLLTSFGYKRPQND